MLLSAAIVVSVARPARAVSLVSSVPPEGSIDARIPHAIDDPSVRFGWDAITITLDGSGVGLAPEDFAVTQDGGASAPPAITDVVPVGDSSVLLTFSGPIEPGAWTIVTLISSATSVRVGYLPGDVDGDGIAAPSDILAIIDHLNGVRALPPWSVDVDRSGVVDQNDVDAAKQLLGGAGTFVPWSGVALPGGGTLPPAGPGSGGAVVELAPTTPGPYLPGEIVTVDVSIRQEPPGGDILIRLMTFDAADSDPLLAFITPQTHDNGVEFWDFSSTPQCQMNPPACGVGYFIFLTDPKWNMTFTGVSPNDQIQVIIPGDGSSVRLAVLDVVLPPMSGTYTLDVMNFDAPNTNNGARLDFDFQNPTTWHVSTGELTGGVIDLVVGLGDPGACCTPPEAPQGEGCTDLLREACEAILDVDGNPAVWDGNHLCGEPGQDCIRWTCQYAVGDCLASNGSVGCDQPNCCDAVCDLDPFCCDLDWDAQCAQRAGTLEICNPVVIGSCCDEILGDCADDVLEGDCLGVWTEGVACVDLNPPCDPLVISCCAFEGICSVTTTQACFAVGGTVVGEGDVCEGDLDGDGVDGQCSDLCPMDPDKTEPGICGCGVSDVDSDGDGVADCIDGCPNDPFKTAPGVCGCGVSDQDTDSDGAADCVDGCPGDPLKQDPGVCGCGVADVDENSNGVIDCVDTPEPVPTVSAWGLLVLALLLLVMAKVYSGRLRRGA